MKAKHRKLAEKLAPWVVIAGLFTIWQAAIFIFNPRPFILPSPALVYRSFIDYRDPIMAHALFTLTNTLIGFGLGILVGAMLGIFIGSSRLIYAGFYPLLIGINSVPKAAVVPLLVI